MHLIILASVLLLASAYNYTGPIVINNGIRSDSYPVIYDQLNEVIITGYKTTITMYSINGDTRGEFQVPSEIVSIDWMPRQSVLVSTWPNNTIYEFGHNGKLINTIEVCGYNSGTSKIMSNKKTGEFYVIYDLGWIYDVYSFDVNHQIITHMFIDKDSTGRAGFDIGELTGNFLFSSYEYIQVFDRNLQVIMNITILDDDFYPVTTLVEFTSELAPRNSVYYLKSKKLLVYDIENQYLLLNTTTNYYLESNVNVWYDHATLVLIYIINQNDKNVPYITFLTSIGTIAFQLNFENDTIFGFYNHYVYVNQKTGTIVANINSQIKIWYLT